MKPDRVHDFMSDTALDREIEALFSVEPSPDFVSRVRTRIAVTTVSAWTMGWTSLAAGSVVVAVVVAVVISSPHEIVQPEAMSPVARTSVRVDTLPDEVPVSPESISAKSTPRHKPYNSKVAFREPQMLINPKEAAAIRHFLSTPQPERVELSFVKIEPQPLPEYTFMPLPVFNPPAVLQGEFK